MGILRSYVETNEFRNLQKSLKIQWNIENLLIIVIKHLQMNKI